MKEFQLIQDLEKLKVNEKLKVDGFIVTRTEKKDYEILHKLDLHYADNEIQTIILIKNLKYKDNLYGYKLRKTETGYKLTKGNKIVCTGVVVAIWLDNSNNVNCVNLKDNNEIELLEGQGFKGLQIFDSRNFNKKI